ncbi:hypothetical protein N24_2016 [Corynebacterium suranareeae]|uniref:Uncharacterized protein n=1 Tax=Corynebacterium suranareeae TaxID=2506452 RepID=A0A169RZB8_9CORY|nr:hypothetical protein [Corynebacterium suranareeae]BAU96278.1 hypothetical protein N24_2016 [Corynebacterium suranareeae]
MNATLVIMPGSPALVPQLAPRDTAGARLLKALRLVFEEELAGNSRSINLVGSRDQAWFTQHAGNLRAWGAPSVQVSDGNYLPEILQRVALGSFEQRVDGVRDRLEVIGLEAVTVLALDGPTGLTARAPSALIPGAQKIDGWCQSLLSGELEHVPSKEMLIDASLREPQLWLDLAALVSQAKSTQLIDTDDTHGVGRYVARWTF